MSYHLPNSAAVYFDTGVIELATPAMEFARGCMARAGRSLWESIALTRGELDRWERRAGRTARLEGFSTHYNLKRRIAREVPIIDRFAPMRHTSRRGWLARFDCYPSNPFACDVDAPVWTTTAGRASLREIARRVFDRFGRSIARVADPFSLRLIASILRPGGASLLCLPDRPAAYADVGRLSVWNGRSSVDHLTRSRYERALMNAVAGRKLRLFGAPCTRSGSAAGRTSCSAATPTAQRSSSRSTR